MQEERVKLRNEKGREKNTERRRESSYNTKKGRQGEQKGEGEDGREAFSSIKMKYIDLEKKEEDGREEEEEEKEKKKKRKKIRERIKKRSEKRIRNRERITKRERLRERRAAKAMRNVI